MFVEVVTFKLPEGIERDEVVERMKESTEKWSQADGLLRKTYIYDLESGLGGGIYHWSNLEAADRWHDQAWCDYIKAQYGAYPEIQRFEAPILVDNEARTIQELPSAA